jgi:hypothetical protein
LQAFCKELGWECGKMALKWSFLAFGIILAEIWNQIELTLAVGSENSARSIGR